VLPAELSSRLRNPTPDQLTPEPREDASRGSRVLRHIGQGFSGRGRSGLQTTECRTASIRASGEDSVHHIPLYVRKPEVAACVAVGEALVVETQQVQDRRVKVAH